MKITDKEFCKMYSSYYGETIDNIAQLVRSTFDGEELKEFIEHCIKCKNNVVLDDVMVCEYCNNIGEKSKKLGRVLCDNCFDITISKL